FRLAKLTACRKKCAFLSVPRHEVKASNAKIGKNACSTFATQPESTNGDHCRRLQDGHGLPSPPSTAQFRGSGWGKISGQSEPQVAGVATIPSPRLVFKARERFAHP